MSKWTRWLNVQEATELEGELDDYGIYQVRIVDARSNPIPICRFCKMDVNGLIYFGRSAVKRSGRTISNRIKEFVNLRHSGGRTYAKIKPLLNEHADYKEHQLQFSGKFLPLAEIKQAEAQLLNDYLLKFGELPPCNSSQPKLAVREDV